MTNDYDDYDYDDGQQPCFYPDATRETPQAGAVGALILFVFILTIGTLIAIAAW